MLDEQNNANNTFIFNSIFTAMGVLLLGVATWIGINVANIPVMKNQLENLTINVAGYVQQLNDIDKRLRVVEAANR